MPRKRTHARSQMGKRAYSLNPFYRGSKVTVIGAISITKVVAQGSTTKSLYKPNQIEIQGIVENTRC
jgi:hypothetical protein